MNLDSSHSHANTSITRTLKYNHANIPKIIAIIGPTCSGKSNLSLQLAPFLHAYIFSIDSLSIYQEINIASAKPSSKELSLVRHFAIDILKPNEKVHAGIFIDLLHEAIKICQQDSKNLIIVGGSSFYLKSIIQGLSPRLDSNTQANPIFYKLLKMPLSEQYKFLQKIDNKYAMNIQPTDTYRIQKGLEIFAFTNLNPTQFFLQNPPTPFPLPIQIYNLCIHKDELHNKIHKRTKQMIQNGILDEAKTILEQYGHNIQPFKSIGLKECLMFLQGNLDYTYLESLIATHTKQLAKRQNTFNRSQFKNTIMLDTHCNLTQIIDSIATTLKI